jgi:hypothetical protein
VAESRSGNRAVELSGRGSILVFAGGRPLLFGAAGLFAILCCAYAFSIGLRATRAASITGDEPFYLLTTQSLLQDGDLDLRQQYERESYRSFFDHRDGLWRQSVPTSDGRLLSPHEPGLSVLVIPGFAAAGLRGVQVELLLLTALTFSLAFVLAAGESGSPRLAWAVTLASGLSASAFVYATEVYPEVPAALCLVLGLLMLRRGQQEVREGAILVALLTLLVWFGEKYAPLGSILAVVFLLRAGNRARAVFVLLSIASAAVYAGFHLAVYHDLTAYSVNTVYEGAPALDVLGAHLGFDDRAYRLYGLFLDRRFGIGHWTPLFLLVPPALPLLLRGSSIQRTAFALICAQVLIATFLAITMMGWWFPGRTLISVVPLFPLALVAIFRRLPRAVSLAAALTAVPSLLFTLALQRAVAGGFVQAAVEPFEMASPLWRWSDALFPDYRDWTGETVWLTLAWLGAGLLLSLALGWRGARSLPDALRPAALVRRESVNSL